MWNSTAAAPTAFATSTCSMFASMNSATTTPAADSFSTAARTSAAFVATSSPPSVVSSCRFSGTSVASSGFTFTRERYDVWGDAHFEVEAGEHRLPE